MVQVALEDQRGIEAGLRAGRRRIEVAGRAGVAAPVLVVALVGCDEGERGHVPEARSSKRPCEPSKPTMLSRRVVVPPAFLNALEVDEGVVLDRVEVDQGLLSRRGAGSEIGVHVREEAVAVVDVVGAGGRQALLVALPAQAPFERAGRRWSCRRCRWRPESDGRRRCWSTEVIDGGVIFVRRVEDRRRGVRAGARDRADVGTGRDVERRRPGGDVGRAVRVVPVGAVVVEDAEVRSADDLEVVGEARVRDREVVGGGVRQAACTCW